MSELRVIKKYPNRRLYDTVESRYITLDDVRRLVLGRIEFCVIDKRSQQDITRPVLLQVIADQEQRILNEHGLELASALDASYQEVGLLLPRPAN